MNIQQQIASFKAARAAKAQIIKDIMEKSGTTGETLDAETSAKYDEAKAEIAVIDKHLERLHESEALLVEKAVAVSVTPPKRGEEEDPIQAARKAQAEAGGHSRVIAVEKQLPPGIQFARFVKFMAMARGSAENAYAMAKETYPEEAPLHNIIKLHFGANRNGKLIEKATVDGAITTNAPWAGALVQYRDLANEFIEFLRPQTIIGQLKGYRAVPFKVRVKRQTGGASAGWVGEGKASPVSSLAFDTVLLDFTKLLATCVLTDEIVTLSTPSAELEVRNDLAAAIVQTMDSDFIDPNNAGTANVKPASVTNGVTPVVASGTTTQAGIAQDVLNVFAPWLNANVSPKGGVWIMTPVTALALSLMQNSLGQSVFPTVSIEGGTFQGLQVITSQAAGLVGASDGAHIVVLLHAPSMLIADDGTVTVDASFEAAIEMSDAPGNSVATGTGASLVSMYQNDSVAIRAKRWINWVKGRPTAAQYLTGIHWGGFPS